MSPIDETIREFLVESFENLEQLDRLLLVLESSPGDEETLNTIFRIVHTVKGTCGFFEFKKLEQVSHVGENLLDSLRAGRIRASEDIVTALLRLCDTLRELLTTIGDTGAEGQGDYSDLVETLGALNERQEDRAEIASTSPSHVPDVRNSPAAETDSDDDIELLFNATKAEYESRQEGASTAALSKEERLPDVGPKARKTDVADTTLRVDVQLLDNLMNLVGELVLARNQILQHTKNSGESELVSTSQRLNLITSELQEGVMRTRMQPIATVWNKLPRIVRDIAGACGKQVRLEMHGKETELDKTIVEAIKDPLTHIIRNAVDHGIESPNARRGSGKDPEGTLSMRAFHEGGQVIIEISDDGRGLDTRRIRAKAVDRGLLSAEKAEAASEDELQRLIFLPGFSTAEQVTNLSGRGVGMDVVRSNIERIGGTIDLISRLGQGTTFVIKIPLTLAIIPALIVASGHHRYAIPQVNLLELVRIDSGRKGFERLQGSDFYRLRGKLLPLVYLSEQLELPDAELGRSAAVLNIVVVRADHHQFGLVVDAVHDTEEIVVKPLGRALKSVSTFAGATIMGDGEVALILDVVGIGRRANVNRREAAVREQTESQSAAGSVGQRRKMLVFHLSDQRRGAVPLDAVYRLEEFTASAIERAGEHRVIQYRNSILPLVDLKKVLAGEPTEFDTTVKAFVYRDGDRLVGFVVSEILDIVEQEMKLERPYRKAGVSGSAVIQDRVTDIVDLAAVLQLVHLSGADEEARTL